MTDSETYAARLGEASWRWVVDQVRWDDEGPWIPQTVPHDGGSPEDRTYSYFDGLASAPRHLVERPLILTIAQQPLRLAPPNTMLPGWDGGSCSRWCWVPH